jgi:hypothetical protein
MVAWQYFLVAYSRYGLTVESDKLVSIAGIAQEVAEKLGDEFLCGLWKSYMLQGLLWRRLPQTKPNNGAPFPATWRAPTWSWASTNFQVNPSYFLHHRKCAQQRDTGVVEKLDVDTLSSGQLKHAALALRGRILHAKLTMSPTSAYKISCKDATGSCWKISDRKVFQVFLDVPNRPAPCEVDVVAQDHPKTKVGYRC